MKSELNSFLQRLSPKSQHVLESILNDDTKHVRFFSYGSNMNGKKFERDMKMTLKLVNARKRTLSNFKRGLSNDSKQGLAFTISQCKGEDVEGVCHDIPIDSLKAFLKKEGLVSDPRRYELVRVSIPDENQPVLTLEGICPGSTKQLNDDKRWKTLQYLCASIVGAREFGVYHQDMLDMKKQIETELHDSANYVSVEKLYDWGIQRQISWSVVILTCFVGLIELLPEMKWHPDNVLLSLCLVIIYVALAGGLSYSVYIIKITSEQMVIYEKELQARMKDEHKMFVAPHLKWITQNGKVQGWIFWVVAVVLFILWTVILLSKFEIFPF